MCVFHNQVAFLLSPSALSTRDENGRPRCAESASSLSDSWCCQKSLLLVCTDLLAEQKSHSLPAHLSALSRNSREICSFLPSKAPASPGAFINACLFNPRLPPHPPRIHTLQPILPRRGLAQLISGQMSRRLGEGHLSSTASRIANKARRAAAARHTGEWEQLPTQWY